MRKEFHMNFDDFDTQIQSDEFYEERETYLSLQE